MNYTGCCPRCGSNVKPLQMGSATMVCECGWLGSVQEKLAEKKNEQSVITMMVVAAIALAGFFGHFANWGSHAVRAPLLKGQALIGVLSTSGYQELAKICMEVHKYDCAQDAHLSLFKKKGDVEALLALARLQTRLNQRDIAAASYKSYFANGGKALGAAVEYATILEMKNDLAGALKYYDIAANEPTETLPVRATQGVVRLLLKKGHVTKAYSRITAFHGSAGNAKGYLNKELAEINAKRGNPTAGSPKAAPARQQSLRLPASSS